jgi:predicted CoA-substrate-specific enzyme activase
MVIGYAIEPLRAERRLGEGSTAGGPDQSPVLWAGMLYFCLHNGRERSLYSVGIDVGSSGVKGIVLSGPKIVATAKHEMLAPSAEAAQQTLDELFLKAGKGKEEGFFVVATGMGMDRVRSANTSKSVLTCLTRGSKWYHKRARTIVDIGAETTTAISLDPNGKVLEYVRNNKCAAGTAMLLKVMSDILDLSIDEMGEIPYSSEKKIKLSNTCSVFAESEAISYLSRGIPKELILAGVHEAIVDQLMTLLARIDVQEDLVLSGGAARNKTLSSILSERLACEVHVPPKPEFVAALGASLFGQDLRAKA